MHHVGNVAQLLRESTGEVSVMDVLASNFVPALW